MVVIIINSNIYVFFFNVADYYKIMFKDILFEKNVIYATGFENTNAVIKNIARYYWSKTINNIISLPFKNFFNKYYYIDTNENKKIIFVFHGSFYFLKAMKYFPYLKSAYPDCKCVMLLTDTVDSYCRSFKGHFAGDFDVNYLKKTFDAVVSYNICDAKKYGFYYYPLWYSSIPISEAKINDENMQSDVFFIGRSKDRLDKIHDVYINLKDKGLVCKFIIYDVSNVECKYKDIMYNKFLSYKEVLRYINGTKAIVEITQGGASGFTLRVLEALTYDKILITDNEMLFDKSFFPYGISKKLIKLEAISNLTKEDFFDITKEKFNYKGEYSPFNLIKKIEQLVKEKNETK